MGNYLFHVVLLQKTLQWIHFQQYWHLKSSAPTFYCCWIQGPLVSQYHRICRCAVHWHGHCKYPQSHTGTDCHSPGLNIGKKEPPLFPLGPAERGKEGEMQMEMWPLISWIPLFAWLFSHPSPPVQWTLFVNYIPGKAVFKVTWANPKYKALAISCHYLISDPEYPLVRLMQLIINQFNLVCFFYFLLKV